MMLRRNRSRKPGLEAQVDQLAKRADNMERFAADAVAALAAQQRAMEGLEARIGKLELAQQVWSTMAYLRDAAVEEKARVSVILATRNRSEYLPRAVESVLAQSYPTWELIVVDDGSDDATYEVLGALDDERIHRFRTPHRGLSAARNRALAEVSGDLVAYLDDDNTMHPDWLRSIVWAFTTSPQIDFLYGAMIIDTDGDGLPWLRFIPYDRVWLERDNLTDIGALAHRAELPEAIFDEELDIFGDWDLLLRAAQTRDLLALPVVAGTYTTSAPDRLSVSPAHDRALRHLRRKHNLPTDAPDAHPTAG